MNGWERAMKHTGPRSVVACCVAASTLLAGCGSSGVIQSSRSEVTPAPAVRSEDPTTVVREAGTVMVPAESLEDIARWGSSMLVVSVTGENARSASSAGPGEVEIGRDLAVRVEQVVWQHPGAVTTVSAGDQLSIYTFPGYVEIDGQRSPARAQGALRMEVGQRYAVALTDDITDGAQVLTLLNTFLLEADAIRLPDSPALSQAQVAAELEDLSTDSGNTGPEKGESLLQRVERAGQPR